MEPTTINSVLLFEAPRPQGQANMGTIPDTHKNSGWVCTAKVGSEQTYPLLGTTRRPRSVNNHNVDDPDMCTVSFQDDAGM